MAKLEHLSNFELVELLDELSKIPTSLSTSWVTINDGKYHDLITSLLPLTYGRLVKPIFITNLKRDVKDIMVKRFTEEVLQTQYDCEIAV